MVAVKETMSTAQETTSYMQGRRPLDAATELQKAEYDGVPGDRLPTVFAATVNPEHVIHGQTPSKLFAVMNIKREKANFLLGVAHRGFRPSLRSYSERAAADYVSLAALERSLDGFERRAQVSNVTETHVTEEKPRKGMAKHLGL